MSIKIIGTSSGVEADTDTDKNIKVVTRPPAFGALGAYTISAVSSAIIATGAVGAIIFSMRWADATRLFILESIEVDAFVLSTITTAVPYDLALFPCRAFSVADAVGTVINLASPNGKRRTSMGASLVTDMRINATLAAGLTPGTRTPDVNPQGRISGNTGTVVGNHFFGANPQPLYRCDLMVGSHPLVLAQNEGFEIQAPLAGPATGTFQVNVKVSWMEVAAY